MMSRSGKLILVLGIAIVLSSAIVPLSSYAEDGDISGSIGNTTEPSHGGRRHIGYSEIELELGISPFIGIDVTNNAPGTDVSYVEGVYSKTMSAGEFLSNFGTTSMDIYCNVVEYNSTTAVKPNCRDNGWSLVAESTYSATEGGSTYAAMRSSTGTANILSTTPTIDGTSSTWAMQVIPAPRDIVDSENTTIATGIAPVAVNNFGSMHIVPSTSTEILTGNTFPVIGGTPHFIGFLSTNVRYGISVSSQTASGTYTGIITYTVSLKASS